MAHVMSTNDLTDSDNEKKANSDYCPQISPTKLIDKRGSQTQEMLNKIEVERQKEREAMNNEMEALEIERE